MQFSSAASQLLCTAPARAGVHSMQRKGVTTCLAAWVLLFLLQHAVPTGSAATLNSASLGY
jgi:hypothetical protein